MPEGDSIFRSARSLHRVLAGHVVTRFETAYAHLDRVNVDTPIGGRTIDKCESAGKHLLIVFSGDLILRTHMRMSGSWHLYRHNERWWRGLFKEFHSLRAVWKNYAANLTETGAFNTPQREFADRQEKEADKLLGKLDRYASEHSVPQTWR